MYIVIILSLSKVEVVEASRSIHRKFASNVQISHSLSSFEENTIDLSNFGEALWHIKVCLPIYRSASTFVGFQKTKANQRIQLFSHHQKVGSWI